MEGLHERFQVCLPAHKRIQQRHICPPSREEKDGPGLVKITVPASSLTESGRLWYLKLYEAPTEQYRFIQSKLDPSMYLREKEDCMHLLVVQVEDYLYVGSMKLATAFEVFV